MLKVHVFLIVMGTHYIVNLKFCAVGYITFISNVLSKVPYLFKVVLYTCFSSVPYLFQGSLEKTVLRGEGKKLKPELVRGH